MDGPNHLICNFKLYLVFPAMLSVPFSSPFINMMCIQYEKMNKKPKLHFIKNIHNILK